MAKRERRAAPEALPEQLVVGTPVDDADLLIGKSGRAFRKGEAGIPLTEGDVLNVPEFAASQIAIFTDSNDFTLVFARQVPVMIGAVIGGTKLPCVSLHLSPQTAKDLSILLMSQIEKHEAEWGEIRTGFAKRRAAEKKAKKK